MWIYSLHPYEKDLIRAKFSWLSHTDIEKQITEVFKPTSDSVYKN